MSLEVKQDGGGVEGQTKSGPAAQPDKQTKLTALALALAAEVGQAQNGRDQDPGAPGQGADAPGQGREADGALGGGQGAGGGAPTAGGDPYSRSRSRSRNRRGLVT